METTKLTLRPCKEVVALAHQIARAEKTSITQIFTSLILARYHLHSVRKKLPLGPLTRAATGLLQMPAEWDYKKEMETVLEEKYGQQP